MEEEVQRHGPLPAVGTIYLAEESLGDFVIRFIKAQTIAAVFNVVIAIEFRKAAVHHEI